MFFLLLGFNVRGSMIEHADYFALMMGCFRFVSLEV